MPGGRGNGKGSQRSGKGRNNRRDWKNGNGNKKSSENSKSTKRSLSECIYSVGTSNQTSEYEVITAHLINHIKKTYKWGGDIAHALTSKTDFNFSIHVPTEDTVDPSITNLTL